MREVYMSGPLSDSGIYTTPAVHRDCHTDRRKCICNIKILYNNNLAYMSNFVVHEYVKEMSNISNIFHYKCLIMFLIGNTCHIDWQTYCTVWKYSLTLSLPILNKEKHCKTPGEQLKGLWSLKLSGEAPSPRHPKGIISEMIWDQHWPCGLLGGGWGTTLT